jgi:hypothetical protein
VTVKLIKKKQKKKAKGGKPAEVRVVVVPQPQPSFFNFFSAPENVELDDEEADDEEAQMRLEGRLMLDFEVRACCCCCAVARDGCRLFRCFFFLEKKKTRPLLTHFRYNVFIYSSPTSSRKS